MPKAPEKRTGFRARKWVVAGAALVVFASTAWGSRSIQHFLSSDPRFILHEPEPGVKNQGISIAGITYTSSANVFQTFRDDFGRSIFNIDIKERRRRLLAVNWIEDASVSRVWPNRLYVRIRERKPVAFVRVPNEAFLLVDGEGFLLAPPPRANFGFPILSGVWTNQTEAERKVRVQAALRLLDDLGPVAKDVSEIDAGSLDDLRITTEVQGKAVELWLGDENFGQRYRNFIAHFADIRVGSPRSNVFDLRIDDRITAK